MQKPTIEPGAVVQVKIVWKDGVIICEPACAYLRRMQTIEWICEKNQQFAVHLGYDTPFEKEHHQSSQGQATTQVIRLPLPNDIRHGRYKYTVALFDGENVWIEDPELIIRR